MNTLNTTVLHDRHVALGAKMVDFSGWEMPLQYKGIIHEHLVVREKVGIFDVSHMGMIFVNGSDAETFLQHLSANRISDKPNNSATYTTWCHPQGGTIDDLLVYRQDLDNYFVIGNASNRQKDLNHMLRYKNNSDVEIIHLFDKFGIIAVQGPNAQKLVSRLFPQVEDLAHMHFIDASYQDKRVFVSNSGYTGSGGYEFYAPQDAILALWDYFLENGQDLGIEPIGLGARDTLRLEMGYALYGHELTDEISPNESVSAWTVKMDETDFLGRESLKALQNSPNMRHEYGVKLLEPGIARQDYEVLQDGKTIGKVTSGTLSPSLNVAIAIIIVNKELKIGDYLQIKIRDNLAKAEVVKLPFWHDGIKE